MTTIKLPIEVTAVGQPLYQLSIDLSMSSDDGRAICRYNERMRIYEGNFSEFLTHDVVMLIANNGGEIIGNLMYAECPVAVLNADVPKELPKRTMKKPGGGVAVKKFKEWADSHLTLMYSEDYAFFYITTDPIQKEPLKASDLKIAVDSLGIKLLTITEYSEKTGLL